MPDPLLIAILGVVVVSGAAAAWLRGRIATGIAVAGLVVAVGLALLAGGPGTLRALQVGLPWGQVGRLAAWGLLAILVRAAGGVAGGGLLVFLGAAAFGAPAVGQAAATLGETGRAGRILLLALAGGLAGPLGNPVALLLGFEPRWLIPLAVALGLTTLPAKTARPGGSRLLAAAAVPVWLLAVLVDPDVALGVALVLAAFAAVRTRGHAVSPGRLATVTAALAAFLLVALTGVPGHVADAIRFAPDTLGALGPAAVVGAALAGSALVGTAPLALVGGLAAAPVPLAMDPDLLALVVAAAVVGGALPLLARKKLARGSMIRWAIQALVVALVVLAAVLA